MIMLIHVNGSQKSDSRAGGRYDMVVPSFNTADFEWFNERAPWLPAVRKILGPDCVKIHQACAKG